MNITDISGIGDTTAQQMKAHGFDSVEAVAQATVEQLVAVPGIGAARAAALKESASRLLADTDAGTQGPAAVPISGGAATDGQEDGKGKGKDKDKKKRKEKRKKGKKDKKGKKEKKGKTGDKGGKMKKGKRK